MRFDHRRILATAIARLRAKLKYRPVVFELMAREFTLTELQRTVEAISGRHLHKQNFRRLVETAALVEPTGETSTATGGRPAALFRFRREVVQERPAPGLRFGGRAMVRYASAAACGRIDRLAPESGLIRRGGLRRLESPDIVLLVLAGAGTSRCWPSSAMVMAVERSSRAHWWIDRRPASTQAHRAPALNERPLQAGPARPARRHQSPSRFRRATGAD